MADQTAGLPAFVATLTEDNTAAKALERRHPDYTSHVESWRVLIDAFEGAGGFLTGDYLFQYPREDDDHFIRRKAMARYHNYLEALVDLYVRFIWTHGVNRSSDDEEYNAWLQSVDGQTRDIDSLLKELLSFALVTGHAAVLIDKTTEAPEGEAKADELATVIARVFSATAIADWRIDQSEVQAVKLLEAAPAVGILEDAPEGTDALQYLVWAKDGWARYSFDGEFISGALTGLDAVPCVVLRPKPSYSSDLLGRPLVSNANILRAMFNRAAEEDEVIRAQAFSVLTVAVPPEGDVNEVKESLGNSIGTAKALVVKGDIDFKTPDQSVPGAIRDNVAYLVREVYRMAHVRHESGGLQRESADAIRLQYTELNEMLQGISKALADAELAIARAYFAWQAPSPEQAQAAFEAANVSVTYPSEFFLKDLIGDLEAWAEAIRLGLGPTMTKRIKKRIAQRIDPDIPAAELEQVHQEIDAMPDDDLIPAPVPIDRGQPGAGELDEDAA